MTPTQKKELVSVANRQAEMKSLWPLNPTLTEALLVAAIRHLHAVIEADRKAADASKKKYWDLESEL